MREGGKEIHSKFKSEPHFLLRKPPLHIDVFIINVHVWEYILQGESTIFILSPQYWQTSSTIYLHRIIRNYKKGNCHFSGTDPLIPPATQSLIPPLQFFVLPSYARSPAFSLLLSYVLGFFLMSLVWFDLLMHLSIFPNTPFNQIQTLNWLF